MRRSAVARVLAVMGVIAGIVLMPTAPSRAEPITATVTARPIDNFRIGSEQSRFGPLEFIGGLEMTASSRRFGGLSALRFVDAEAFIAVSDTGDWLTGKVTRDDDGRLSGVTDLVIAPILDGQGAVEPRKTHVDAEGLALRGTDAFVAFERQHRIARYALGDVPHGAALDTVPLLIPLAELRRNAGIETIAAAPDDSVLEGALVIVSERSLNRDGDIFAAVLDGPRAGVFFVRRHAPFDVTDGAFLPNGDLLLLERRFSWTGGIGMQIRHIDGATIAADALVDGPVILDADFGNQIDNMEGMDIVHWPDGAVSVFLLSDDNHSILQRNLLLEFRLPNSFMH
jgi:hypothetical protein